MTALREKVAPTLVGKARPRVSPPLPARTGIDAFRQTSADIGIDLMPWQDTAARYLTATGPAGHLYHEVCIVVARQNGKTTLMKPYIIEALRAGKKIMHIAQTRELPRVMFGVIADALSSEPDLFPKRRGKVIWPRYGAGQEEIVLANGGSYRIAAAKNGGARGWTNDLVIIDELREMYDFDIIQAAAPTLTMTHGQMVYLSNAGDDRSVVLNSVRDRADEDPDLAYLEWSADPEYKSDDRRGWVQANPAIGHFPGVLSQLERQHRSYTLGGILPKFETEHLCRWVPTLRSPLISPEAWMACHADKLGIPRRPVMGISMDPNGKRASVVMAWQMEDQTIAVRQLLEATGEPIDVSALGDDIRNLANDHKVITVGFDPMTDGEFAKYCRKPEPISGRRFANASSRFALGVQDQKIAWHDADALTDDLAWTTRKEHDESGSYQAVRADDDRPITAALAAIRAVELASGPPIGGARIW